MAILFTSQNAQAQKPANVASAGIAAKLQPFVDNHSLAGAVILVANKDKVLILDTVGYADIAANKPLRPDALFWIASQSKPITATALMMLVDEGKVKLDDPVEKYLPEFKDQMARGNKTGQMLRKARSIRSRSATFSATPAACRSSRRWNSRRSIAAAGRSGQELRRRRRCNSSRTPSISIPTPASTRRAGSSKSSAACPTKISWTSDCSSRSAMKDTTFWPNEEQLKRLAKSYKPNRDKMDLQESTIGQLKYPLNDRKRQPMPAGGLFSTAADVGPFLPDDAQRRQLRREAVSFGGCRQADDQQANGRRVANGYGCGWAINGDTFGHGGAFATNMSIDPKRDLITIWMVQHSGFPGEGGKAGGVFKKAAEEIYGK